MVRGGAGWCRRGGAVQTWLHKVKLFAVHYSLLDFISFAGCNTIEAKPDGQQIEAASVVN